MTLTEFILALLCLLILTFTAAAGLGGAGIIIPIMMGFYHFDAKNAVTLSNFSTSLSGVVRYISNLRVSHPLKNGKGLLSDYNIISIMLPASIIGASIGSIVNLILPSLIILSFFIFVTTIIAYVAVRKYLSLRKSENSCNSVQMVEVELDQLFKPPPGPELAAVIESESTHF